MAVRLALLVASLSLSAYSPDAPRTRQSHSARVSHRSYAWSLKAAKEGRDTFSVDLFTEISGVNLTPTYPSHTLTNTGLTRGEIDQLVEAGLRKHGVPLCPDNWAEQSPPDRYADLSMRVLVVRKDGGIAYSVTMYVTEDLARQGTRDIIVDAPIWECHEIGITDAGKLKAEVVTAIHTAVADFSEVFKAAH